MNERRWYHLHWTTTAALMLVGGCLAWCDFVGSHRSLKYLWVGTRSFGWPLEHFDGRRDFSLTRAVANFLAGSLILVSVAAVLEPPRRVSARKPQFRLATLLVVIADVAALTALVRTEVEWPDQRPPISSRLNVLGH